MSNTYAKLGVRLSKRRQEKLALFTEYVNKWRKTIHLDPTVEISILPKKISSYTKPRFFTYARVITDTACYHEYEIEIQPLTLDKPDKYLETLAIHELCHILVYPYYQFIRGFIPEEHHDTLEDTEEAIVTRMEWAFASQAGLIDSRLPSSNG